MELLPSFATERRIFASQAYDRDCLDISHTVYGQAAAALFSKLAPCLVGGHSFLGIPGSNYPHSSDIACKGLSQ
jgi:hypothetical protein